MTDPDLDALAEGLAEFDIPDKPGGRSLKVERIIAGFEDIQRFVEKHGRAPLHGEDRDIFERLYAVRLDRLRALPECRAVLEPLDHQGLLGAAPTFEPGNDPIDIEELEAALLDDNDLTQLRHVRATTEKRTADDVAQRKPCADFDKFAPLFERVRRELKDGSRYAAPLEKRGEMNIDLIQDGQFFIVGGQIAYIAEVGKEFTTQYDRNDSRLRVIYDNGTESDVLLRSFQRAFYRDDSARLIVRPEIGPLFDDAAAEDNSKTGTIYVLRSKSANSVVAANRDVLHKIGVTGGKIETRVASASLDPTFLLAEVEILATYTLYNINRVKLENVIHRVFDPAQLDIEINDRFGNPVRPREWFLVPFFVIDEAVGRIKDGSITDYVYDPKAAKLVKVGNVGLRSHTPDV
jgi:hypothetical protein